MKVLWIIPLALFLAACDVSRYTPATGEKDQLFIVDKWTGKVAAVEDGQLIDVPSIGETGEDLALGTKEYLGIAPVGQNFMVTPKFKYRDGKLLYKVRIGPGDPFKKVVDEKAKKDPWYKEFNKLRKDFKSKIYLDLHDKDGFIITKIDISLYEFTQIVDFNQKPSSYTLLGDAPIGEADYKAIDNWDLTWSFAN
jgi:hypothetical protein